MITTIPKIDFIEETVECKNMSFTVQKETEVIHGEVKGTEIYFREENQSDFSDNVA